LDPGPERTTQGDGRPYPIARRPPSMALGRIGGPSKEVGKMELAITLGLGGWLILFAGALLFGVVAQFIGETRTGYEWLVDGAAAIIGGLVASEFLVSMRTFGPVWDGLALVPALIGGLVLGIVVEVATRYLTGGHYTTRPMAV
jgi:uncharacterized membrane protein YeaQ/YmgE (transglycosylase-associated protein family)